MNKKVKENTMAKILYVKANPKPDEHSNTFKLANKFLDEYKKKNPQDEIITLDLYKEHIRPLDDLLLQDMFNRKDNEALKHAQLFASADKYIIAAPMWNLSIPAILKAYFDYVTYVGITFKYTEQGPVGLLSDKPRKLLHVVTRGGMYSEGHASAFELGDKYIRTIAGFMGIVNVATLLIELTNVLPSEELASVTEKAYLEAEQLALEF